MNPAKGLTKLVFSTAIMILCLGATSVMAETAEPAPDASAEAAAEVAGTCEAPAMEPVKVQNQTPLSSGPTWHLLSNEYCRDRFGTSCYSATYPAPFCSSSNPTGQSCSPFGSKCWVILSSSYANEYWCR